MSVYDEARDSVIEMLDAELDKVRPNALSETTAEYVRDIHMTSILLRLMDQV